MGEPNIIWTRDHNHPEDGPPPCDNCQGSGRDLEFDERHGYFDNGVCPNCSGTGLGREMHEDRPHCTCRVCIAQDTRRTAQALLDMQFHSDFGLDEEEEV